jgi:hypothetical protein
MADVADAPRLDLVELFRLDGKVALVTASEMGTPIMPEHTTVTTLAAVTP